MPSTLRSLINQAVLQHNVLVVEIGLSSKRFHPYASRPTRSVVCLSFWTRQFADSATRHSQPDTRIFGCRPLGKDPLARFGGKDKFKQVSEQKKDFNNSNVDNY